MVFYFPGLLTCTKVADKANLRVVEISNLHFVAVTYCMANHVNTVSIVLCYPCSEKGIFALSTEA